MRIETRQHPPFIATENPRKKESIFNYYSVPNEVNFVRGLDHTKVSGRDASYYVSENVFRFLGEFAGHVPYTSISYTLGKHDLEYAGLSVSPSYKRSAEMAGSGSREADEYIGQEKIKKAFLEGAQSATLISPPKIADYGFVFHFRNEGGDPPRIKEYILRYEEKMGETVNSQGILEKLAPELTLSDTGEFLRTPIATQEANPDLVDVMRMVGISDREIVKSLSFESRVRKELSVWTAAYVEHVFRGNIDSAQRTLTAIYNRAIEIKLEDETGRDHVAQPIRVDDPAFIIYSSRKATVEEQGSCPVTRKNWGDPLSPTSIYENLIKGKSPIETPTNESGFVCPKCDFHATSPVGDQCPNCKLTKDEYANSGGAVC